MTKQEIQNLSFSFVLRWGILKIIVQISIGIEFLVKLSCSDVRQYVVFANTTFDKNKYVVYLRNRSAPAVNKQ